MFMTRRFGFRGALLILFGLTWIILGIGVIAIGGEVPNLPHTLVPTQIRCALWVASGVIAIIAGVRRTRLDKIGWVALYFMPALKSASYLWGTAEYVLDGGGYALGWIGGVIYGLFVGIIAICYKWPEPVIPGREELP